MLMMYLSMLDTDVERDKLTYFYSKHKGLLMRIALDMLKSHEEAENAVHDTFVAAIEHRDEILTKTEIDFRNWSVIVIKRKCLNIIRSNRRYNNAVPLDDGESPEIASDETPIDLIVERKMDYERLIDCISELDGINRQILEMKYILDMSFKEICSELNMTLSQVNSRLERVRQKIRMKYGKGDE
jgi:RNA polymerase sigma-70 factor (ECF subfamily)